MRAGARAARTLLLLLAAGCSRTADGVAAWNEGRFEDAHRAFAAAAESAGDGAPVMALVSARIGSTTVIVPPVGSLTVVVPAGVPSP